MYSLYTVFHRCYCVSYIHTFICTMCLNPTSGNSLGTCAFQGSSAGAQTHIWGKNEYDRHYPNFQHHQESKNLGTAERIHQNLCKPDILGISTIEVLELAPRNQIEKEPRVSEAPSLLLEAAETDYELSSENDLQLHTGRKPLQRDAGVMRRYAKYSFETKSKWHRRGFPLFGILVPSREVNVQDSSP